MRVLLRLKHPVAVFRMKELHEEDRRRHCQSWTE